MIKRIKRLFSSKKVNNGFCTKINKAMSIIQSFQLENMSEYTGTSISTMGKGYVSVFVHTEEGVGLYLELNESDGEVNVIVNKMANDDKLIELLSLINNKVK